MRVYVLLLWRLVHAAEARAGMQGLARVVG